MKRVRLIAAYAVIVAGLAAAVWADCVGCGGDDQNVYCCVCVQCNGNSAACTECTPCMYGDEYHNYCKYHTGEDYNGCCAYQTRNVCYQTREGSGVSCPCAGTGGSCGTYRTDVIAANWTANQRCTQLIAGKRVPGQPDQQFDAPPYSCTP